GKTDETARFWFDTRADLRWEVEGRKRRFDDTTDRLVRSFHPGRRSRGLDPPQRGGYLPRQAGRPHQSRPHALGVRAALAGQEPHSAATAPPRSRFRPQLTSREVPHDPGSEFPWVVASPTAPGAGRRGGDV